jgi:hypothetical protein
MCDTSIMDLRNHVRRLTMAALQFPKASISRPDLEALRVHIEHQCVELSLLIHSGKWSRMRKVAGPLGALLADACRRGLFGSFELSLMDRELSIVNEFLSALPGQPGHETPAYSLS